MHRLNQQVQLCNKAFQSSSPCLVPLQCSGFHFQLHKFADFVQGVCRCPLLNLSLTYDINVGQMYEITLSALKTANNERLWFNTNVKLGKLYLELGDHFRLQNSIKELHK